MKRAPIIRDWRDAIAFAAQSVCVALFFGGWLIAGPLILEVAMEVAR